MPNKKPTDTLFAFFEKRTRFLFFIFGIIFSFLNLWSISKLTPLNESISALRFELRAAEKSIGYLENSYGNINTKLDTISQNITDLTGAVGTLEGRTER